ncbi:CHAT domain-containing protein [Hyalangium sp.]|uniref:CHAT domain-containing protein n=1 Tax=Hyalangium sp. TaxID=2028555 RepID=UPI002D2C576C|nr:CHAT domain-containing protein [Hyalangium sp.]HYH97427.1 CHAT domain-containing protein [Hyalangium sp.]
MGRSLLDPAFYERATCTPEVVSYKDLYKDLGLSDHPDDPLTAQAPALEEATFGSAPLSIADVLTHIAQRRLVQHRLAGALPLLTCSFAISEQRLRREALNFSEARLASFLQRLRSDEERLYALLRAYPEDTSVRRLALSAVLLLKGRSVEETADISRVVYRSLGPEDRHSFERLRELRTQLAALTLGGSGPLAPADHGQRLRELAEQGDTLEALLARNSAPLRALAELPFRDEIADRVAVALPKDGALVEFIAYTDRPLIPRLGSQPHYLALVLFPDASTRALDLGPAEPIDSAASRLRNALANRGVSFEASAQALYQLAFKPLLPLLGDRRRLFLSPDGQLSLVPFAALHDGHQFLIESYDITYLTSGKDLLPRPRETAPPDSVVVLADPDFSTSPQALAALGGQPAGPTLHSFSLERFFSTLRANVAERPWGPLPGSRQEAAAIRRLIPQAQLFLGAEATKERLLRLSRPGVLHLATHGFFLADAPAPKGSRAVGHFGALGDGAPAQLPPDPLLRSGLVLAGARARMPASSGATKSQLDTTLVTALELAGLDLWGTELVVLSACDTGRGDIRLGQGVYGLRRALVAAGAETVVMSLWKVNDDITHVLMEDYYRNLLAGQGRAAALHAAMRSLRRSHPHPYFWAPFIALGRDAPVRALAPTPQKPPSR